MSVLIWITAGRLKCQDLLALCVTEHHKHTKHVFTVMVSMCGTGDGTRTHVLYL